MHNNSWMSGMVWTVWFIPILFVAVSVIVILLLGEEKNDQA